MARIARKNINTPFLHVMVQGVNKEFIFNSDSEKKQYMDLLNENYTLYNIQILAYCIMGNHVHILFYAENIKELGLCMHAINTKYAISYNKKNNRCGAIFRNRYKIQPIENIHHLLCCINYIHQNPVKANIVKYCEDYKYSSYNDYLNDSGCSKNTVLSTVLNLNFDSIIKSKQSGKAFIDIDTPDLHDINNYIISGITEYININHINLIDIFCNTDILRKLIFYLKESCDIPYTNIQDFFGISRYQLTKILV